MSQTKFRIITLHGESVWQGEASAIHISPTEQKNNSIIWVAKNGLVVTMSLLYTPPIVTCDKEHTVWLGTIHGSIDDLWKFKPKGARKEVTNEG